MRSRYLIDLMVGMMLVGVNGMAKAITWGEPDSNGDYPNVVSVTGIKQVDDIYTPIGRCSGSLLHIDENKVVILTAAHCTDLWKAGIDAGALDTVGVSFDQNNQATGQITNATNYVTGGIPSSLPEKDSPFIKFDYGLVVFSITATNSVGETIVERWGGNALTPVQVSPNKEYLPDLINGVRNPTNTLSFTVVGYGFGEKFPIPGEETGPADPNGRNLSTFLIRYFADRLSYNAYNRINDIVRFSENITKGENGACNGDSGGPIFYEDENLGLVQVSLVSGGAPPCRSTVGGPGFSSQEAFDFVRCGTVAGDAVAVIACVDSKFGAAPTAVGR